MAFKPDRKFRKDYNQIFKRDPVAANVFLLLAELADKRGQIRITEEELQQLMTIRFEDPRRYALGGKP